MNFWVGDGRLTRDPEMKVGNSGKEYCQFTIANTRRFKKDGKEQVDFIDCVAYEQTSAFITKYFHKGDGIQVRGRFESDKYTNKENKTVVKWGLTVDEAAFPLGKGKADSGSTAPSVAEQTEVDLPF